MTEPLTFAVPKGRILDEALPLMARAGVVPEAAFHDKANRALTFATEAGDLRICLLYTSPSPRDQRGSRMPSSA